MKQESLSPGDIVLVPFPFTNYFASKPRPALVISGVRFNQESQDVILVAITSNITRNDTYGVVILNSEQAFPATRLKVSSMTLCGKIFAMDKIQIGHRLGKMPEEHVERVKGVITSILFG